MTRTEEIEKEAIDYSEIEDNIMEYYDCGDVCDDRELIGKAFIQGAKWSDETMIEKACKWLSLNIDEYITEGSREGISLENQKQLIIDFRKAMEE